jgi:hypothetical protein
MHAAHANHIQAQHMLAVIDWASVSGHMTQTPGPNILGLLPAARMLPVMLLTVATISNVSQSYHGPQHLVVAIATCKLLSIETMLRFWWVAN